MNCIKKILGLGCLYMMCLGRMSAQNDFDRWANRVGWDTRTPWVYYLIHSPRYTGPNAIPIPPLRKGRIDTLAYTEFQAVYQHIPGDDTYNSFIKANLPLTSGKIAFQAWMVPLEVYRTSDRIRDERRARTPDGDGEEPGDLYLSLLVQILRNKPLWPDLMLSATLKTATGGGMEDARYLDAAGYTFDLSAGKSMDLGAYSVRPYLTGGLHVWQVWRINQYQNDAIFYGLGIDADNAKWTFSAGISGFQGYIDNGDRPLAIRSEIQYKVAQWGIFGIYQKGLRDNLYHSISLGTRYFFSFHGTKRTFP